MATVTGNIKTWGLDTFPTDERILIRFVPSTAASVGSSLLPLREERVEPANDGSFSATLASTTGATPRAWYTVRFEWFDQHPIEGWALSGWSELPGRLHVPVAGGEINDLLGDFAIDGPVLFFGRGPAPDWLPSGGVYFDLFSTEGVDVYTEGPLIE